VGLLLTALHLTLDQSVMASADRMWPFAAAAILAWTVLASILHWRRIYLRP